MASVTEKLGGGCWSKRVETRGGIVKEMAAKAVDMFLSRDVSALEEVERLDDEVVDESYEEALLDVLKGADRCRVVEAAVLRLLERASDHAVYIAGHAYHLVTGQTRY
ncbi:MAG: PhoU domain-containing protein [Thermoproteus sp.]